MTTMFSMRVSKDMKKRAQHIAEMMGMDLATCVRMLFTQMIQRGTLPLPRITANGFTEEEEIELLRSAQDSEGDETMSLEEFKKSLEAYYPKTSAISKR